MRREWVESARPEVIGVLRREVTDFASHAGVTDPPLSDVRLALSEAITNSVVHAYREHPESGDVRVSAQVTAHELSIVVADDGMGITPRVDSPGMGLGLPLIESVTSRLEVTRGERGGSEIRMWFAF